MARKDSQARALVGIELLHTDAVSSSTSVTLHPLTRPIPIVALRTTMNRLPEELVAQITTYLPDDNFKEKQWAVTEWFWSLLDSTALFGAACGHSMEPHRRSSSVRML